jgi:hypothetical protein
MVRQKMKLLAIALSLVPLFVMTAIEAADWRLLAGNVPLEAGVVGSVYYDKDSIAYPFKMKGLFGEKPGTSVVAMWTRYVFQQPSKEIKNFSYIYCQRRQMTLKSTIIDGHYVYDSPWLNRPFGIEPNTTDEKLYGILCR